MNPIAPPESPLFSAYLQRAVDGRSPVYGCVIDARKVSIVRAAEAYRPEQTSEGQQALQAMAAAWRDGRPIQPWIYARNNTEYVVSDDYLFLALIEQYGVTTFAAKVLGEPLAAGLIDKHGPLPIETVKSMLGISGE